MKASSVGENDRLHDDECVGVARSREIVVEVVEDKSGVGAAGVK